MHKPTPTGPTCSSRKLSNGENGGAVAVPVPLPPPETGWKSRCVSRKGGSPAPHSRARAQAPCPWPSVLQPHGFPMSVGWCSQGTPSCKTETRGAEQQRRAGIGDVLPTPCADPVSVSTHTVPSPAPQQRGASHCVAMAGILAPGAAALYRCTGTVLMSVSDCHLGPPTHTPQNSAAGNVFIHTSSAFILISSLEKKSFKHTG